MEHCPTHMTLSIFAESGEPDQDVHRHVLECTACREAVAEMRENAEFIRRFVEVRGEGTWPTSEVSREPEKEPADEPDLFAGYQILGEIRRGGQGAVYRALQVATQRTVAIKTLHSDRGASARERFRFEREGRIAAGLRHPNIVTVYDAGFVAGGRYAFAMEYIDGKPLDQWSKALEGGGGRAEQREILRHRLEVVAKVCDAVLYAHQHAIVHRDLKPANILVDSEGEPHVLDFGIVRELGPEAITDLTHTGGFAGTLAYASPEQVSGDSSRVDTRTDIYSLGVILYQMIAGRMPYAVEGSMATMIRNIESSDPHPLTRRTADAGGPFADSDLSTIILKAMAKDPGRRYQTAAGLGNDIRRYLAGEAIEARRDSAWYVIRKFARRKRRLVAAVSVAVLAIVTGVAVAGYGLLRAKDERQQKELQRARTEAEVLAGQAAAQLIEQTLPPFDYVDDERLGRRVRTGLSRLERRIEFGAFAGNVREDAAARKLISSISRTPGWQADTEVLLRQAIAALHTQYGTDHVLVAQAFHDLAFVLEARGRKLEAERWVRQAIELRQRLSGSEDPGLAPSQHLLARLLAERGDLDAADAAFVEAGRLYAFQAPESSGRAEMSLTCSRIRELQGRQDEAETAAGEALITVLTFLSDEDRLLPQCLRRIAELFTVRPGAAVDTVLGAGLHAQSRSEAAAALSETAANLGAQEDSVQDRRRHIAGLEVVLRLKTGYLGEFHIACSGTLALIGDDCRAVHDYQGEAAATERAITLLQSRMGRHHPALIQLLELVWKCCFKTEDLARAVVVRRQMLEIWEAQPDQAKDELWIANEHRWLANTLAMAGEFAEAEREYRMCLEHLSRGGLADHYLADICNGELGWVALHLGRPEEAESMTRAALARYQARAGAPTDQLAYLQQWVGEVLAARGKYAEARPYVESAFERLINAKGVDISCRSWRLIQDGIAVAERCGDAAEAERLRILLEESRRQVLEPRTH